jgi:anti-anti-sigma factor
VKLTGELDLATSPQLDRCLRELTDPVVTLDFSSVTFMDCRAIGVLVQAQQRMRDETAKLVLFGLRPLHLQVLATLGLIDYFDSLIPD